MVGMTNTAPAPMPAPEAAPAQTASDLLPNLPPDLAALKEVELPKLDDVRPERWLELLEIYGPGLAAGALVEREFDWPVVARRFCELVAGVPRPAPREGTDD